MADIANLYQKYMNGDHITTPGLLAMYDHFMQLGQLAGESGPVFKLAALEAHKVAENVRGFLNSRDTSIVSDLTVDQLLKALDNTGYVHTRAEFYYADQDCMVYHGTNDKGDHLYEVGFGEDDTTFYSTYIHVSVKGDRLCAEWSGCPHKIFTTVDGMYAYFSWTKTKSNNWG